MVAERSVKVLIKGDVSDFNRALLSAAAGSRALAKDLSGADDRMGRLLETALTLGPALVPITAAAIPAVAGLTNELGIAALGAGVAALAFNGIGDALKAVNNYAIDPTDAHLTKMNQTLAAVGPAGEQFVNFVQSIRPELQQLQNVAGAGLFPGLETGLQSLGVLGPRVKSIIFEVASAMGQLATEAGKGLAGPKFEKFFLFLEQTARPTMIALGRTLGNFALGFANMWRAFDPLSKQFAQGFLEMSRDFAKWSDELGHKKGFQDFLNYLARIGPKVKETLSALGHAIGGLVHAMAPVGEVSLPIIEGLANAFAIIANSSVGPVLLGIAVAMSAVSRAAHVLQSSNFQRVGGLLAKSPAGAPFVSSVPVDRAALRAKTPAGEPVLGAAKFGFAGAAIGAVALGATLTGLDQKLGLTNTATLALVGSFGGPLAAAFGAGIGLALDYKAANDSVGDSLKRADAAAHDSTLSIQDRIAGVNAEIVALQRRRAQIILNSSEVDGAANTGDVDAALKHNLGLKKALTAAAQEQLFAEAGLTGAMAGQSASVRANTAALLANIATKNQAADAALTADNAELSYREALKAANKQARTNNAGIKGNSDAAIANYHSLLTLAGAWNQVADSGKGSTKSLRAARKSFIDAAVGMGVSKSAAQALARELFHIPSPKVKVTVGGAADAQHTVAVIKTALDSLHDKYITIHTNTSGTSLTGGGRTATAAAMGGYIRGPGTTTSDSIPAWLSDGEYVVRAAAVAKYGATMMAQINAGQFANGGLVQRFADGGRVRESTGGGSTTAVITATDMQRAFKGLTVRLVGTQGNQRLKFEGA